MRTLFNLLSREAHLVLPGVDGQGYNRPEAEFGVGKLLNIGPWEFLLIIVVTLVVFGPGSLPEVARFLGRASRELRKLSASAYRLWDEVTRESLQESKKSSPVSVENTSPTKDEAGVSSNLEPSEAKKEVPEDGGENRLRKA